MTTAVTLLHTLLHGRLVGRDSLNNRYFENKSSAKKSRPKSRRWVLFGKKPEDASLVPAAWHAWLHHTTNTPPNDSKTPRLQHAWQKPHRPNLTGTSKAFSPSKKQRDTKPYEAWTPPSA